MTRRLALLLALGTSACGDDVADPSTSGPAGTSGTSGSAPDGSTSGPTTGPSAPTSDGSAEATGSTSDDPSTTSPVTATTGPGSTSDADTTTSGGSTSDGSTSGGSTSSDSSGDSSGETGPPPPCGPGSPGPDADGDTVPDACDVCAAGDDLLDGDGDGAADACDPCPVDAPDDNDGDGVCNGDDVCPLGDDAADADADGLPDACEDQVIQFPQPIDDYDVAADGAMVVVRAQGGNVYATCYNGDRTVRRPEFVAGKYDLQNNIPAHPTIYIARQSQRVLVTWFDRNGGDANHRIAYSYLDAQCMHVVDTQTALAIPMGYLEFHDAAIDELGNAAVAVSPDATFFNRIDATGAAQVQVQAFDINAVYGTHVAVDQSTGDGIVAAQIHSGNGIYYRRFAKDGTWKDNGPVQVPVNYHYWYDGFTVGMNDLGEFVFLWRSDGTALDYRFFAPDGATLTSAQRMTIDFEGWDGGHCYDSFRRRHQEVPLRGDNFVLGEVYNWITMPANRVVHHFEVTTDAQVLAEQQTLVNLEEGLTIRLDQLGFAYLRDNTGIHIQFAYP